MLVIFGANMISILQRMFTRKRHAQTVLDARKPVDYKQPVTPGIYKPDLPRLVASTWERGGEVHELGGIHVDELTVTETCLGVGGFGRVYLVENPQGEQLALKRFYARTEWDEHGGNHFGLVARDMVGNVAAHEDLLQQPLFARLRAVPVGDGLDNGALWYVAEYAPGDNVNTLLETDPEALRRDEELAGYAALTYAKLLDGLHSQGMLFGDNNWGALIVLRRKGDLSAKVCDYDLVVERDGVEDFIPHAKTACRVQYASSEQLLGKPLRRTGELTSLALMLDHLMVGSPLIDTKGRNIHSVMVQEHLLAHADERDYPRDRRAKLPSQLQQVIPGLIQRPRDESLTLADVIQALERDFGNVA